MKGYRFWRGYGISYNADTELYEQVLFELELTFPVCDPYIIQHFLRSCEVFIYKGKTIERSSIMIPPKDYWTMKFTVSV